MTNTSTYFPGLLLDSRDNIALAILADDSVGISVRRFDQIPKWEEMSDAIFAEEWVLLYRGGSAFFLASPSADGNSVESVPVSSFEGAEANESAQFAIEVALAYWPEWGDAALRKQYKPRRVISVHAVPAEA